MHSIGAQKGADLTLCLRPPAKKESTIIVFFAFLLKLILDLPFAWQTTNHHLEEYPALFDTTDGLLPCLVCLAIV